MKALLVRFNQRLPKLWLFSIYGAVGGLLGALLLGELLFAVLTPRKAELKPPPLQLAVSGSLSAYPGGTNRLPIKIARDGGFTGAVTIKGTSSVAGIQVADLTIPADQSNAELLVTASEQVPVGESQIELVATGDSTASSVEARANCALTILMTPVKPPALRISLSPVLVIDQQAKNKFMARIVRDRFEGDVQLSFTDLPAGVTIAPTTIRKEQTQIDIEAVADKDATVGERKFGVVATGPLQGGTPDAQASAKIMVKPYVPPPPPVVDILFLLDVTASMEFAINGVRDGILKFVQDLREKRFDVKIGLIAFHDRIFGVEPIILTFGPKEEVFTTELEEFRRKVGKLRTSGNNTLPESSLDAIVLGCRQAFRYKTTKVIVHITDDAPLVPDKETKTIEEAARKIEEAGIEQLHFVVRSRHRKIYEQLRNPKTKGQWFDLEKAARGAGDFQKMMPELSAEIVRATVASVAPQALPAESKEPPPPPTAKSVADIPPTPEPPVLKGVTSTSSYEKGSTVRLLLAISVWTAVIAAGVCLLLIVGQNLYLRQAWGPAATNLKGIGGGLLAGIVGGAVGQLLFQIGSGGAFVEILFRIIGWTILGALAGSGIAFFIPNMRTSKGLLGGALGGGVGALGFILITLALRGSAAGDLAARLFGAMLLGFCIGLMLALAERMFRSAWLEINFGENVMKTVNLGAEPVSIGGDSRQCTIFARNAPPVAQRYWVRNGRLIQQDMTTGQETQLIGGEVYRIGAVEVAVFTSSTRPTAKQQPARRTPEALPPRTESAPTSSTTRPLAPPPPKPTKPAPPPPSAAKPPPPPPTTTPRPAPPVSGPKPPPPPPPTKSKPSEETCPSCNRQVAGVKGSRYCIACDVTF